MHLFPTQQSDSKIRGMHFMQWDVSYTACNGGVIWILKTDSH